jgi:GDPmannose 4,6-dehydratase
MPSALITGITGQTGGYLAEQLIADGWAVHGLVRQADRAEAAFVRRTPDAVLHSGDLGDAARMTALVDDVDPDVVFNLGGITSVAASWQDPVETFRVTGSAVAVLLEAAWQLGERRGRPVAFVQASSAELFGAATVVPQNEETPIRPVNPYGAAKAAAHHLTSVYRARGMPASSVILFNHESPRRPPEFVTRKITRGAARIAAGLDSELLLGNLDAVRDWGWAPDYARAIALAAAGPADDYVIATGEAHRVRDFVDAAFRAAGIDDWAALVRQDPAFLRPTDAPVLVGDSSRARNALGWGPTVTFDEMVAAMVEADRADTVLTGLSGDRSVD